MNISQLAQLSCCSISISIKDVLDAFESLVQKTVAKFVVLNHSAVLKSVLLLQCYATVARLSILVILSSAYSGLLLLGVHIGETCFPKYLHNIYACVV